MNSRITVAKLTETAILMINYSILPVIGRKWKQFLLPLEHGKNNLIFSKGILLKSGKQNRPKCLPFKGV